MLCYSKYVRKLRNPSLDMRYSPKVKMLWYSTSRKLAILVGQSAMMMCDLDTSNKPCSVIRNTSESCKIHLSICDIPQRWRCCGILLRESWPYLHHSNCFHHCQRDVNIYLNLRKLDQAVFYISPEGCDAIRPDIAACVQDDGRLSWTWSESLCETSRAV